ncbi:MAG TPA: phospholipase D-like domain-containing protein [Thermoleophilaceae bacterium]|nr:phospholipase D-like domain-containing protein [Thermoleophilaceae bacterium]
MSSFLTSNPPVYRPDDRSRLHVTGITDLAMPFNGAIVLPRVPHPDDAARLAAMRNLDHTDWLHYSFLYPRAARPGETGPEIVFPTLRGFDGKPFGLGSSTRPVAGKVIVLAARGYTLLDDISVRAIFSEKGAFYSPRYPRNASLSATPGFIVLHLDTAAGDLVLPSGAPNPGGEPVTAPPFTVAEGFSPFTTDNGAYQHLKAALEGKTLAGEVYGFDIAGNVIDAYALALVLGFTQITSNEPGLPGVNDMLVQLVDAHGQPLDPAGTTMESIDFDPPLQPVTVGGAGGLRTASFPNATTRDLTVSFALEDDALDGVLPFGKFPYQFRHTRVGLWPGFGHGLKAVKPGGPVVLKLKEGFPADGVLPPFVRICVLHPGDELQTAAGGEIKLKPNTDTPQGGQAVHQDSEFRLFTDQNTVTVFNTGADYFADLVKEAQDRPLEILEGVYLSNWKSEPNVFLHGRMVAHGVERNDAKSSEIEAAIDALVAPESFVTARLDPAEDPKTPPPADALSWHVLVTRTAELASSQTFQMQIERLAEPGAARPFIPIHRGFIRAGGPAAWVLTGTATGPDPEFRLCASWKTSVGRVEVLKDTRSIPAPAAPVGLLPPFPERALALDIDASDPPRATLSQVADYLTIVAPLGITDPTRDVRVIFLHLDSGRFEIIPFNRTDVGSPESPLLLHTFERLFCTDQMAVAIVDWPGSAEALDLSTHLLTHWRRIEYPLVAFAQGTLPLSTEELGGWLRGLIATKPALDLRALYWEHTQANLAPGLPLDRGLSNSAAITAVINRSVAGRSGMAIRDRSTRPLGAFHQKAVVLVKRDPTTFPDGHTRHRVVAYVGGIDLAHGRWDTDEHYHLDPERQEGSGWRDVQVKLEGDAALDVLRNFTQRWQALIDFDTSSPCKPANLVNNMARPFKVPSHVRVFDEPGPLVQITRTWPPASCHASLPVKPFVGQHGELGSLESYLKAIRRAKKFILINDQYLFGVELAQAIREALLRPDGPECAMILLPMNLSEVEIVDPVIYKARKRALDTLYYGATFEGGVTPGPNDPHRYTINPTTGPSLRDRIAIVTPVNRKGDEIYVHSKTMVVDDVFMTIGSANFTFRGTTYEMEINAAVVDRTLQQGGGVAVREQRIELCRRMLGLPAAYAAMMQDWNACFHIFKALETETAPVNPDGASSPGTLNLHPLPPMIKALPPGFAPRLGAEHQAYNAGVTFVMDLDNNTSGMLWLVRNALDVDGRDTLSDQLLIDGIQLFTNMKYLYDDTPYLSEFPHSPPSPYGRLTFDLNPVKAAMISVVDAGDTLTLILRIGQPEGNPPFSTELGRHAVTLDSSPNRNIVIAAMTGSQLLVPIHVARQVNVSAELKAGGGTGATLGKGTHVFDPTPAPGGGQPVTNGVFIPATIALFPP